MSQETSALLGLPYIQAAQAQKHVTHNEALRVLDVIVQGAVSTRTNTSPPLDPTEGDRHIVAAGATGDWAGQDHSIALFETGVWVFYTPKPGWKVHVLSEGQDATFNGSSWATGSFTQASEFGINTAADATNRLSVAAEATLLTHDGAGHQLKINKNASADTSSLLFQTGWSGRAEMGTTGSDDFAIKVSADGSAWTDALSFDATTGIAGGAAVQSSATDTTPGRLARADFTYGPGTVLGTVSETAGQPTGAVIERGANANGDYVRFADGTQICTRTAAVDVVAGVYQVFNFPASFLSGTAPIVSIAHRDFQPSEALEFSNIRSITGYGDGFQFWALFLHDPAVAASPVVERNALALTAIGRWY